MPLSPLAGKPAPPDLLVDVAKLERAYFDNKPDTSNLDQLVSFGTSGHRGTSLNSTFTEAHILATTQAIVEYRRAKNITGPLFMGKDTHALSDVAQRTALEVLAANAVETIIQPGNGITPTPVVSHAILTYNRRKQALSDGIVVTPSHNPPEDGGFKYNPPEGGPASTAVTTWIENLANKLLGDGLGDVRRIGRQGGTLPNLSPYDFTQAYISQLGSIIDMEAIRASGVRIGV